MSERKIVLYLEQEKISSRSYSIFEKLKDPEDTSPTNFYRKADYYILNSLGSEVEDFFDKLNIDREILIDLRKKSIDKIALIKWDLVPKHLHLYNKDVKKIKDKDFLKDTIKFFEDNGASVLFKINDDLLNHIARNHLKTFKGLYLSFISDQIMITKKCLRLNELRYRVYLNDRLLVERYYPIDLESNRMLAEIMYLKDTVSGTLRIESDFNLIIKRVEIDGFPNDIYSSSFVLPNTDK